MTSLNLAFFSSTSIPQTGSFGIFFSNLRNYWLLLFTPSILCSQHHPIKLSASAIQPTTKIAQFTQSILYCGAQDPSHQKASANLKILSSFPKFCFIFITSQFKFQLNSLFAVSVMINLIDFAFLLISENF